MEPCRPPVLRAMASRRIATLDGLRGWAALAVVFYHSLLATDPRIVPEVMQAGLGEQQGLERVLLKLALACCSGEVAVGGLLRAERPWCCAGRWTGSTCDTGGSAPGDSVAVPPPPVLADLAGHGGVPGGAVRVVPGRGRRLVRTTSRRGRTGDLLANLVLARFPINGATWTLLVEMAAVPLAAAVLLRHAAAGDAGWSRPWGPTLWRRSSSRPSWRSRRSCGRGSRSLLAGVAVADGWYDRAATAGAPDGGRRGGAAVLGAGLLFAPANLLLLRLAAMLVAVPVLVALAGTAGPAWWTGCCARRCRSCWACLSFSLYLWNVPVFELLIVPDRPGDGVGAPAGDRARGRGDGDAAHAAGGRPVRAMDRTARHPARPGF